MNQQMADAAVQPAQHLMRQSSVKTTLEIFTTESTTHRLARHSVMTKDGWPYELFTAEPVLPPPPAGHPVLYMLDGNGAFDLMTPGLLASVPGLCIVGIGYDTLFRFDTTRRSLDFTPSPDGVGKSDDKRHPDRLVGGADLFLARLNGELMQYVESRLSIDGDRRCLWGHSLAGLFTLYTLLSGKSKFARHIAASPSVWWRQGYLLEVEARAVLPYPHAEAFVMLGDSEKRRGASDAEAHSSGPAPLTLNLVERLRARHDISVTLNVFAGAQHVDSLHKSFPLALNLAAAILHKR